MSKKRSKFLVGQGIFVLLFVIESGLTFYMFSPAGSCGTLPKMYGNPIGGNDPEVQSSGIFININGQNEEWTGCKFFAGGYKGFGYPAYYIKEHGLEKINYANGWFYPQFLLLNILWVGGLSFAIMLLLNKRHDVKKNVNQPPQQNGGLHIPQ